MLDKKHYDIGIVGWWYNLNYGGTLTYYALNDALKSMGYSVLMVQRSGGTEENTVPRIFAQKHYNISASYTYNTLGELNQYCDTFIVGSDQLWNPYLTLYSGPEFFLSFVEQGKKKISYSTSFGNVDHCDAEFISKYKPLIQRFDAVSVREDYAVRICASDFEVYAQQMCDPIFLCSPENIKKLAYDAHNEYPDKYVLNFLLDPNQEKIDKCRYVRDKLKINDMVNFTGLQNVDQNIKNFEGESVYVYAEIEELIKAYRDANFVITDSYHGTCLAIIFNKPFISIANMQRGEKRFISLLNWIGLRNRLVMDLEEIDSNIELLGDIDYQNVKKTIEDTRERCREWLKTVIETPKEQMFSVVRNTEQQLLNIKTVTSELDKTFCTGCGSCVSICPVNALFLKPDNLGYYRFAIDYAKCISCGKCVSVCPAIKLPENWNTSHPQLFEFIAADEKVLYNSSSGGAFPIFARETFKRAGVVVGAAWRDDFSVEHIIIDNEKELYKLQKSKYLQSYLGDIFRKVKEKLEGDIFVLFSCCPCQAAGLKAYLQKEYDNLIIVDLLCGNSPSTMFFQKYIATNFNESLKEYEFRHKGQGWNADCIFVTTVTGVNEVRRGGKQDNYQRVYHNHVMCAPHCEKCNYQTVPRFGDLTIGDFWGIDGKDKTIDTSKGVSAILCNNEKGRKFLDSIPREVYSIKRQVPLEWLGGNGNAINGSHNFCSPKRNDFYKAIKAMSFTEAIVYALKPNHGVDTERGLFDFCAKENHFTFNPSIWNEDYINGTIVLTTRESNPRVGNYAVMPIHNTIKADKAYILKIRFKLSTNAPIYNFHLKSAGESLIQVIYSHKVELTDSTKWVEVSHEFVADSNVYDEFMIGASQLSGENRWLVIDYIKIFEKI